MITQAEAEALLEILKKIKGDKSFQFPEPGERKTIDLVSDDGKQEFIVDVNRKGYINVLKRYSYQGRYQKDVILLRLDINGPDHTNPDEEVIRGNHVHIYREGYNDKWAFRLPPEINHPDDMYQTLIDFLRYFKTINANELEIQTVM